MDLLFTKIDDGVVLAATSFYALHELYVFALENVTDLEMGYSFGKPALERIMRAPGYGFYLLCPAQREGALLEDL